MDKLRNRAKNIAGQLINLVSKLNDIKDLMPYIIAELLRAYGRYGLAELVEKGWDWKPGEEEEVNEADG